MVFTLPSEFRPFRWSLAVDMGLECGERARELGGISALGFVIVGRGKLLGLT